MLRVIISKSRTLEHPKPRRMTFQICFYVGFSRSDFSNHFRSRKIGAGSCNTQQQLQEVFSKTRWFVAITISHFSTVNYSLEIQTLTVTILASVKCSNDPGKMKYRTMQKIIAWFTQSKATEVIKKSANKNQNIIHHFCFVFNCSLLYYIIHCSLWMRCVYGRAGQASHGILDFYLKLRVNQLSILSKREYQQETLLTTVDVIQKVKYVSACDGYTIVYGIEWWFTRSEKILKLMTSRKKCVPREYYCYKFYTANKLLASI